MKRAIGALRFVLALALGLVALCAAWLAWGFWGTRPVLVGGFAVEGASAQLSIVRDRYGAPHVFAATEEDVYFGLGFAHAQDRIFQMDLTRRAMQGRLSELVGSRALEADKRARMLGWTRAADTQLARLSPATRATLEAYTAGVNAAIRAGATSPEYFILLARPEPWRPQDTAAVWLAMTDLLTGGDDIDRAERRLSAVLTPAQIAEFLTPYPEWAARSFRPGELPFERERAADPAPSASGLDGDRPGSNAWVVDGRKSGTGHPVLANDPHLGLAAPGPFYLARLTTPEGSVVGATLPGAPFVVIGHNGKIAWGTTTHPVDAADLRPLDPAAPFQTARETIRIRDHVFVWREETIETRWTADGPALDPQLFELEQFGAQPMVLRTIADDPDNGIADAVAGIVKAQTVAAFFEATRVWVAPPQSLVVASVDGDIGLVSPGRFPARDEEGQWTADIPFEGRLEAMNPPEGWFGTGNNLMPPPSYPWSMQGRPDPYRVTRIAEVLGAQSPHGVAEAVALQGDEVSMLARRLKSAIEAATPQTPEGRQAQTVVRGWDGVSRGDRPEGAVFAYWLRALGPAIYGDELGPDLTKAFAGPRHDFLDRVLVGDLAHWCDDVATDDAVEPCALVAGRAFDEAAKALAADHGDEPQRWRWGDIHQATFPNLVLSGLPLVGEAFTVRAPKGGDGTSVNVARNWHTQSGFETRHAAGMRIVADLGDLDATLYQVAPGQSGHAGSPHYRDLAPLWARNEGFQIRTDWTPAAPPDGARTLSLRPR